MNKMTRWNAALHFVAVLAFAGSTTACATPEGTPAPACECRAATPVGDLRLACGEWRCIEGMRVECSTDEVLRASGRCEERPPRDAGPTGGDASTPDECVPGCEGDVAVSCIVTDGRRETVRRRCSAGQSCVDGNCVDAARPTSVTVSGSYGSARVIYAGGSGAASLRAPARYAPELPARLDTSRAGAPTISTPRPSGCTPSVSLALDATNVAVTVSGPMGECAAFLEDAAARGVTLSYSGVPYSDGHGEVTLQVRLTP